MIFFVLVSISCTRKASEKIILKMGDSHPDRNSGVGAVIEWINAEFLAEHPEVEIVTESYQDQLWQEKVTLYASSNQLPDIVKYWTFPGMMLPLIDGGLLGKLNKADFSGFGYLPGALESSEFYGELYGIPVSADLWVLFVNKSLFEKAGVPLPSSWEDIIASVPKFKSLGITPIATDGKDAWPLCIFFDNIVQRISGDFSSVNNALTRKGRYTDPEFTEAAAYIQNLIRAGVFSGSLTGSDYNDSRNQFGQEQTAMYMMGSWEMSLAADMSFSETFRDNLDVISFPVITGGKGTSEDLMAWYGGNYTFANSGNKELAYEYLKFLAERFGAYAWEAQAFFPAQIVNALPNDTVTAKKLLQIAAEARSTSGTPGLDRSNSVFKEDHQNLIRQLCDLAITPEEFCRKLDASAKEASKQ